MSKKHTRNRYDVIVVGAGHAGIEAAAAAARLGVSTLLLTLDLNQIGRMSCNPSIGGLGKGHLVREIDALGGVMALAADATCLQFRMLNTTKGPAVRAPRAQADKVAYPRWMRYHLEENYPTLDLAEGEASRVLLAPDGSVRGVELSSGDSLACRALVVTAGTHLNGLIHLGMESHPGGRWGERASVALAESLRGLGLQIQRLKTGTPARLDRNSIRWDALPQQPGDVPAPPFSYLTDRIDRPQIACAITYTNPRTHEIILEAMDRSPLYTGKITGVGPRYCPSIETKLVRFADRERHQLFLEPESLHNDVVYVNGVSTSLPADTQDAFLHTIEGLENVRILRYGYGIEYDAFPPEQMRPTLECRAIPGLYLAGQLNGTTGYEEAAGLGLLAGANAALRILEREPLTFLRDEAYLGVMVDDLLTKGAPEPYRLFTSRAEYRLLLRQDNADLRLTPKGREAGLVGDARWERFLRFRDAVDAECERLEQTRVKPEDFPVSGTGIETGEKTDHTKTQRHEEKKAERGEETGAETRKGTGSETEIGLGKKVTGIGSKEETEAEINLSLIPREAITLDRLLSRPEITYDHLRAWGFGNPALDATPRVVEQVEIRTKYAGYIARQNQQVERGHGLETRALPATLDFSVVPSLRKEAAAILSDRRPATVGQASRLPGVNPADITAILIYLKVQNAKKPRDGNE
jgi:tRNA uridine 5-carboxymethylaminomethyl modification enzyme